VDSVVEGRVHDAETGAPVLNAVVTVRRGGITTRAVSDDEGVYCLPISPGLPVHLTVKRYGYAPLSIDGLAFAPGVIIDFALEAEPVPLTRLTVYGDRLPRGLEELLGPESVRRGVSEPMMETTVVRNRVQPFTAALQVAATMSGAGQGGSGTTGVGGTSPLSVAGYLTRQGATFVDGAPAMLAEPISFLADPFRDNSAQVQVWSAGAPARVTGGLEYVAQVEDLPSSRSRGLSWDGRVDLVRSSADLSWQAHRMEADVLTSTTDPWAAGFIGEQGHGVQTARVGGWGGPWSGQRVAVSGTFHRETLPADVASALSAADLDQATASARWQGDLGKGSLTSWIGASRSRTTLPNPKAQRPPFGISVDEDQSSLGVEYRTPLGRSFAVDLGADRLGYRWSGSRTETAAVWGIYAEASYAPAPALGLRFGTRLDRSPEDHGVITAPRVRLDWRVAPTIHLAVGSGVFHQALLVSRPEHPLTERLPELATGVHYRASALLALGPFDLSAEAYLKRMKGVPDVPGTLDVGGIGLGLDGPIAGSGHFTAAGSVERRHEPDSKSWNPVLRVGLQRRIPGKIDVQLQVEGTRAPNSLLLGGTSPDSIRVLAAEAPGSARLGTSNWSLRSDVEASRTLHGTRGGPVVRAYAQVLNALGKEYRPLSLETPDGMDQHLPRVFILGLRVGFRSPPSESGRFAR